MAERVLASLLDVFKYPCYTNDIKRDFLKRTIMVLSLCE